MLSDAPPPFSRSLTRSIKVINDYLTVLEPKGTVVDLSSLPENGFAEVIVKAKSCMRCYDLEFRDKLLVNVSRVNITAKDTILNFFQLSSGRTRQALRDHVTNRLTERETISHVRWVASAK